MKRVDYLADQDVAGFVQWAGHLVRGERSLEHRWKGKGPAFQCSTLYEAFRGYLWPNSVKGDRFTDTVRKFEGFRREFENVGVISDKDRQDRFIANAQAVAKWGGINNLRISSERHWGRLQPTDLQNHISEIKRKLEPASADTDDLPASLSMSSSFSKIYAALIPGLPIYDSRVACALTCLIRLYQQCEGLNKAGDVLFFPIPQHRGSDRCTRPAIWDGQGQKYAVANLKCAWLLQGLLKEPGEFANVPEHRRLDALQSALFMLGYQQLRDDAIVKEPVECPRERGD